MDKAFVLAALKDARSALDALIANEETLTAVADAAHLMAQSIEKDGRILSCGNGGSL